MIALIISETSPPPMLRLWCGAVSASIGIVVYLTMEKLNFPTFRIAKKGIMGFQISFALTVSERTVSERTVTEMLEAETFLIAIGIGLLVYAVRDGLSDIKHEIWELRMDLRDKGSDGE